MMWRVCYSDNAKQDLKGIYTYIKKVLCVPDTAKNQAKRIKNAADSLIHMPMRHRLLDYEPWRSRGVRAMVVDGYIVIYHPNERSHIVSIIRILHGRRDIKSHL